MNLKHIESLVHENPSATVLLQVSRLLLTSLQNHRGLLCKCLSYLEHYYITDSIAPHEEEEVILLLLALKFMPQVPYSNEMFKRLEKIACGNYVRSGLAVAYFHNRSLLHPGSSFKDSPDILVARASHINAPNSNLNALVHAMMMYSFDPSNAVLILKTVSKNGCCCEYMQFLCGNYFLAHGNLEDALEAYEKALLKSGSFSHPSPSIIFNIASIQKQLGFFDLACRSFVKLIPHVKIVSLQPSAKLVLGQYETTLFPLNEHNMLEPVLNEYIECLVLLGNYELVVEEWEKGFAQGCTMKKNPYLHALIQTCQFHKAEASCMEHLKLYKADVAVMLYYADVLVQNGKTQEAVSILERIIEQNTAILEPKLVYYKMIANINRATISLLDHSKLDYGFRCIEGVYEELRILSIGQDNNIDSLRLETAYTYCNYLWHFGRTEQACTVWMLARDYSNKDPGFLHEQLMKLKQLQWLHCEQRDTTFNFSEHEIRSMDIEAIENFMFLRVHRTKRHAIN